MKVGGAKRGRPQTPKAAARSGERRLRPAPSVSSSSGMTRPGGTWGCCRGGAGEERTGEEEKVIIIVGGAVSSPRSLNASLTFSKSWTIEVVASPYRASRVCSRLRLLSKLPADSQVPGCLPKKPGLPRPNWCCTGSEGRPEACPTGGKDRSKAREKPE